MIAGFFELLVALLQFAQFVIIIVDNLLHRLYLFQERGFSLTQISTFWVWVLCLGFPDLLVQGTYVVAETISKLLQWLKVNLIVLLNGLFWARMEHFKMVPGEILVNLFSVFEEFLIFKVLLQQLLNPFDLWPNRLSIIYELIFLLLICLNNRIHLTRII